MTSQDLAERYGAPAPWRRRTLVAACATLAAVGLAWLAWTAWSHSTPDVKSELVAFDVVDEHTVEVRLDVRVTEDATDVRCLLRAFSADHNTVGELSFEPDPTSGGRVDVTMRTERRATSVEAIGCTAADQTQPR